MADDGDADDHAFTHGRGEVQLRSFSANQISQKKKIHIYACSISDSVSVWVILNITPILRFIASILINK